MTAIKELYTAAKWPVPLLCSSQTGYIPDSSTPQGGYILDAEGDISGGCFELVRLSSAIIEATDEADLCIVVAFRWENASNVPMAKAFSYERTGIGANGLCNPVISSKPLGIPSPWIRKGWLERWARTIHMTVRELEMPKEGLWTP